MKTGNDARRTDGRAISDAKNAGSRIEAVHPQHTPDRWCLIGAALGKGNRLADAMICENRT